MQALHPLLQTQLEKHESASIIDLVDGLLAHAYTVYASDIHIDPTPEAMVIRMRIDGVLYTIASLPKLIRWEIISRIKILACLRTDEHVAAQDGRFRVTLEGATIDVRVSILPTYYGENAVLRLLVERTKDMTLDDLGLTGTNKERIVSALKRPHGMILATGPTGSGKTTTLYSMLKILAKKSPSIVTIEDPIEYAIDGVRQVQINQKTGLTFAHGLRAIVRQDPDCIMVGEIRDHETADLAINSSLTGHLLLSTLHTNDAVTTLIRLLDMGVEPYLLASTVRMALAQRLVRRVCESCKEIYTPSSTENAVVKKYSSREVCSLWKGKGCAKCNQTGYRDRIGVFEVLVMTDELRHALTQRASTQTMREYATASGMTSLESDGIAKALSGITTLEEVMRITCEE
ncbi:type II/IV secretion system protein [Candidatus Uhrbacteria bacterium]|nr:type II/IV secretion system protein [Candidatus Uhrbacteria bacterium]